MEGVDGMISDVGGVRRGVVTEIWGPPGVGKTSFGYVAGRDVTERVDRWGEDSTDARQDGIGRYSVEGRRKGVVAL